MAPNAYSIYDIAEWFLHKRAMPQKKLQKLCYYAVAWCYALCNADLVYDTTFEAWVHGPASQELYNIYKDRAWEQLAPIKELPPIDETITDLLESVWETYGNLSGNALEALTHTELPWQKARAGLGSTEPSRNVIDKKDMRDYYLSIYDRGAEA